MRLRIYALDKPPSTSAVLEAGQSPNLDRTIVGPSGILAGEWRADSGEVLAKNLIITIDGWIRVTEAGTYRFRFQCGSGFTARVAGARLSVGPDGGGAEAEMELPVGWQRVEAQMEVAGKAIDKLRWMWRKDEEKRFAPIPDEEFRAAAFHFRPTQPGIKRLMDTGDRPGLGRKLVGVHPGYRLTNIRPGGQEMPVGGLALLEDGRLVVARFDARTLKAPRPTPEPNGELWIIDNPQAARQEDVVGHRIATGLFEPSGVCLVKGAIYVSQRSEVTRFDLDGAGGWKPTAVANGWETNDFHQISAGLLYRPGEQPGHPGWLFMARSPGLGLFKNPLGHGSVWKIDLSKPPGKNVEWLTGGHRTPNGIGFGPHDEMFVIDNQGNWTPANEINHVQKGHFYGFYQPDDPPRAYAAPFQPEDPEAPSAVVTNAAVLLPQDEIGNSPTQPLLFPPGTRYAGQLAVPDMRYGGINRVFLEEIDGVWQGCAMRFTQGLEAGPNRICFGPGGSIYVGGIGGRHASTWSWRNPQGEATFQGLERLDPTDEAVFEIENMRAIPGGFELHFTEPVPVGTLENKDAYRVMQWTYRATSAYGGPKVDEGDLTVSKAEALPDGRSVRLSIDGLKKGYVIRLRCNPVAVSGRAIWSGEVWYTLNRIPG
ncbi:MAG: hypothetical protein ACKO2G_07405 [Verrucomicrobiales bacterium]